MNDLGYVQGRRERDTHTYKENQGIQENNPNAYASQSGNPPRVLGSKATETLSHQRGHIDRGKTKGSKV